MMGYIKKNIEEIREIIKKSSNPIFYFDNDVDGLCSFLLLRRYCEKGKGVVIKSFPELDASYARKVRELNCDYIFVLDKPKISKGFIEQIKPNMLIWIDHHPNNIGVEKDNFIFFNPTISIKINRPTTYWVYKIIEGKENFDWIAAIGCLGDWYIPSFIKKVYKKYPDLFEISEFKDAGKIIYETSFGKIINILNFGLKDTTTNIMRMLKFLIHVNSPYEILEENEKNRSMHRRFKQIYKKFSRLLEKAGKLSNHDIIFFQYGGNLSISAEIANALLYKYPKKLIVVAYLKGGMAKISIRSSYKIYDVVAKAMEGIDANFGGHESALGANMRIEDLQRFKKNLVKVYREFAKND
jgi:single-stranded DNA-specific DHH superfamily exonuclease